MKRSTTLLLIAALLAAPATVHAQADSTAPGQSDTEEARRRFQRGVDLYREGSFDAALAEFNKAYELAPNYRVLYNQAQVQTERHDYLASLKLLDQYLRDGAAEITPERREQVEQEIKALKGRIAEVTVVANVDGAEVLVDGVPSGELPLKAPLVLNSGVRRFQVRKDGYDTSTRAMTIAGGEALRVDFVLRAQPASARAGAGAATGPMPAGYDSGDDGPSRAPLWISLVATGVFAGGAVTAAVLTNRSDDELERELGRYPSTEEAIDDARSELKRNALLTDVFTAAAAVAGGFSIYFALSGQSSSDKADKKTETARSNVRIMPAGTGLRLRAQF
jgi:hypothetical protein